LAIIIALVFLYVALHSGSRQPDVRIAGPDKLGAEVGREPIDTVKKDKQPDTDIVSEPPAASEQEPTQTSTFNALEKAPETRATTAEVVQAPVAPAADIELETPVLAQTESVPPADAGSPAPESVPAMPADAATSSETTVAIVQDLPHASVAAGAYVRTALLGGHWSGQGRPADVFPSENTECNEEGGRILCQMAVNKGGGGVSYQVEARLDGFSTEGDFQVSYRTRTLAGKLDDQQAETPAGLAVASGEAQVSEHTMSCKLIEEDEILCRDPSGAPRYFFRGPRRAGP
jgi:hypothetical protein